MKQLLAVIVLVALVALTVADWGQCPSVKVQKNFKLKDYVGEWYEISRFRDTPFEQDLYCVRLNYDLIEKKSTNFTATSFGRRGSRRGDPVAIPYIGFIPDEHEAAKMRLNLTSGRQADYWVLDTDYDHYAVVFSCREILKVYHRVYVWILGRKPTIPDATKDRILDTLREYKIPVERFMDTAQDGCTKDLTEDLQFNPAEVNTGKADEL